MICLDRFQKVLAAHLDIDFETLPSIADVLIAQGFRGMSVGEKITYFDEQAIKRVRDGAESKAVDSGTLESKEIDFKNKDEAIKYLENLKGEKLPKELSEAEFLTQGLSEIVNKENFLRHTKTRIDSDKRLKYLNLVEPTLEKYNIKLSTNERNTYIKKFETQDNNLYYMLITDDGDKLLITGIPTNQFRNIRSKIKNADLIQTFTSQDSKNPQGLNGLSSADSSTESKITQGVREHSKAQREAEELLKENPKEGREKLLDELSRAKDENDFMDIIASYGDKEVKKLEHSGVEIKNFSDYMRIFDDFTPAELKKIVENKYFSNINAYSDSALKALNLRGRQKLDEFMEKNNINTEAKALMQKHKNGEDITQRLDEIYTDLLHFSDMYHLNDARAFAMDSRSLFSHTPRKIKGRKRPLEDFDTLAVKVVESIESEPLILHTDGIKSYAQLNKEFKEAIKPILNTDITNKETGITAQISSTGVNKIKSKVAIDKSLANGFSKEEHFEVAKNLKELFEDSKYLSSETAKNNSPDIKAVHRYGTNIDINDKQAQALFTLKESVEHGHKIYSLELQELIPLSKANTHTTQSQQGQSNLSKFGDMESPTAIEKIDKGNGSIESKIAQDSIESAPLESSVKKENLLRLESLEQELEAIKKQQDIIIAELRQLDNTHINGKPVPKLQELEEISHRYGEILNEIHKIKYAAFDKYIPKNAKVTLQEYGTRELMATAIALKDNGKWYRETIEESKALGLRSSLKLYKTRQKDLKTIREALEKCFGVKPLKKFGENYAEYYHDGDGAIRNMLFEANLAKKYGKEAEYKGQVAGAFHKEGLGDIDLVWGEVKIDSKGEIKGYGLSKIIEKHFKNGEFEAFGKGESGLINGLNEIIEKGKVITENNVSTIIYHKNNSEYRVGLSKGWDKKGENEWIITAYEIKKSQGSDFLPSSQSVNAMSDGTNLHSNDLQNPTIESKITQDSMESTESEALESSATKQGAGVESVASAGRAVAEKSAQSAVQWESKPKLQTQGTKSIKELRFGLKASLAPILNTDITNKQTGIVARISSDEINKISSKKAIDKSVANGFSKEQHFLASENLQKLFQNANLSKTHDDLKARENIQAVHRFSAPLDIDGQEAVAKITLFEKKVGNNKIYSLELENLEKPTPLDFIAHKKEVADNAQSVATARTEPTTIAKSSADSSIESKIAQDSVESTESKALESSAKEGEQILENVPESASVIEGNNIKINALQAQRDKAIQEMTRQIEEFLSLKEQAYDKARATLKGKPRYSHSEFQAQVEKEELYTKALTYKQNAQELGQKINALESQIGELIEANYVLNKTSLTQMLANTTDEAQKIQIVKPYLKHQIKLNEKELENLENILKNRDYFAHEISQKLHALQENAELKNLGKDELLNLAKEHLDMDYFNKIKELQKQIKLTRSKISRLDFDYKRSHYAPNKRRLIKNLAQIEKQILKEVDLKTLEERLTYDLNTKEGVEKVRELFLSGVAKDEEQKALFERVLPIAQKLGVQVRHAINNASLSQKVLGLYNLDENLARVKYNKTIVALKGQTLLHELIHSVTSRALIAFERGFRDILSPNQIKAIENLESIYKQVYENREALGLKAPIKDEKSGTLLKGDYALENTHEFLAELSNPTFREKLKTIGVFEKIINAITKLFVALTKRDKAEYSAYKATKEALFEIIDNYNPNFSKAYEDLPLRGGEVEAVGSKGASLESARSVVQWESKPKLQTQGEKTNKVLRDELKNSVKDIINTDITNKQTGISAYFKHWSK